MIGFVICVSLVVIYGCKIVFFFFLNIGSVLDMALDKAHNCWTGPTGRVWSQIKNPFIKQVEFGFRGWACRSSLDIKKSNPNLTCCHSYT